jgi:hypothetical protein
MGKGIHKKLTLNPNGYGPFEPAFLGNWVVDGQNVASRPLTQGSELFPEFAEFDLAAQRLSGSLSVS